MHFPHHDNGECLRDSLVQQMTSEMILLLPEGLHAFRPFDIADAYTTLQFTGDVRAFFVAYEQAHILSPLQSQQLLILVRALYERSLSTLLTFYTDTSDYEATLSTERPVNFDRVLER